VKKIFRTLHGVILLGAMLAAPVARLHAQENAPAAQPGHPHRQHMDEPETNSQEEQYRHSPMVDAIAHFLGVKTETAAEINEDLNSGILVLAIAYFLWKIIPGVLRGRSETLRKDLTLAHAATEDANRRLAEVEARLSRLDGEIDGLRRQAEKDAAEEEKRMQAALQGERERIVSSAEQEIAAAQSAAQRELKKFAADLAIDNAMHRIQLSTEADRALVREFGAGLSGNAGGKA